MVNKKVALVLGSSIILGVLIYFYQSFFRPQPLKIAEIGVPSGSVSLSLAAPTPQLPLNQDTTITLAYNSPTEHLTAVQVEFDYNPAYLTLSNITPSLAFATVLQSPIIQDGKVIFAYGVAPDSDGLLGSGTILTFTARALQLGPTSLTFTPNTLASTIERSDNALASVASPTLTIIDPSTIPSTSPSPSPSDMISPPPTSPSPSLIPSPSTSNKPGDLDGDGHVNFVDFNELITYFGTKYNLGHFNDIISNFEQ